MLITVDFPLQIHLAIILPTSTKLGSAAKHQEGHGGRLCIRTTEPRKRRPQEAHAVTDLPLPVMLLVMNEWG